MKQETFQPKFPPLFTGATPVWGQGNNLCSLQLLASIPIFTLYPEGSRKRKKSEKEYWEQKDKEYNAMKQVYDKNCFVGTIWKGNTSASAKITKIVITEEKAYVCYKASDEHIAEVAKQSKKEKIELKPVKSGKFGLNGFLSAISNGTIQIVSIPSGAGKKV